MSSLQARCICHLIEAQVVRNHGRYSLNAKSRWTQAVCCKVTRW
jgi:hypothetical protein